MKILWKGGLGSLCFENVVGHRRPNQVSLQPETKYLVAQSPG
jgi:hypothetical protein